ncbi:lysine exporter LysO family protein [Seleniivibrio woodruffii]|uniref:Lysine exporter LysO-like protein n=1 Tax=Seleniivibrio woodruffii TaxID=1078050 RepID=A0A4R1K6M9_9BACT|nr:lysine exporter LysO family protein [Seleniivibrio woodruffii]TCK59854.1 lysine exporter LysO-like protein [Seleniivibrio woodruffii]TVZ35925.1 lysine exporter LysO-like protein [Seleniivibrio woodruffii]
MIAVMLIAILAGAVSAYLGWLPEQLISINGSLTDWSLILLLFLIGFDIGNNKQSMKTLMSADRFTILVPVGTILGTLFGGYMAALITSLSVKDGLAIASGFGWYSFSAVLISQVRGSDLGAIAFLSNIFRETITLLTVPFIVRYFGPYAAVAPGGATTMDVTLPVIEKYAGKKAAIVGFVHGVILSTLAPVFVPLFL